MKISKVDYIVGVHGEWRESEDGSHVPLPLDARVVPDAMVERLAMHIAAERNSVVRSPDAASTLGPGDRLRSRRVPGCDSGGVGPSDEPSQSRVGPGRKSTTPSPLVCLAFGSAPGRAASGKPGRIPFPKSFRQRQRPVSCLGRGLGVTRPIALRWRTPPASSKSHRLSNGHGPIDHGTSFQ
jgi:hypothetical protein